MSVHTLEDCIITYCDIPAHSELATAGGSGPLATIISKNVDKAIRLFNMKCDEMVSTGTEALQVSGPPNYAQLKNISVVNTLHLFHNIVNQVYCGCAVVMSAPHSHGQWSSQHWCFCRETLIRLHLSNWLHSRRS